MARPRGTARHEQQAWPGMQLLADRLPTEPIHSGRSAGVLTVDVEDWYHVNYTSAGHLCPGELESRVEENTHRILDLLDAARSRGTFFILGSVARSHPGLVAEIASRGHELACHGLEHHLIYHLSPVAFREALRSAQSIIEEAGGAPVRGFRAPSWSITEASLWALDVLVELGFTYDSSIFPVANYLYGIARAPTEPYRVYTRAGSIVEIPPSVWRLGPLRIPHGGGFYLRLVPLWAERISLAHARRRGRLVMLYLHPRELDPAPPHLPLSLKERFIQDFGHARARKKIAQLVGTGGWTTVGQYLAGTERS